MMGRYIPVGQRLGEPVDESEHFYRCIRCSQLVDKRDLEAVMHHELRGHRPIPQTQADKIRREAIVAKRPI